MKIHLILAATLAASCTVYREPDGHLFAQVGGRVHMTTPRFEILADNQASFKDATRLAGALGLATIAAGVVKAQDATQGATDKAAIEAGTKAKEIEASTEAARMSQEIDLRKLDLEAMEIGL
jgi:hypothetical protein